MTTPCEWAAEAINDKGKAFKLAKDGKAIEAPLTTAEKHDIGGGWVGYQFGWNAPINADSPSGDGIYDVSGSGAGDAQLFLVYSAAGGRGYWAATVTCQG